MKFSKSYINLSILTISAFLVACGGSSSSFTANTQGACPAIGNLIPVELSDGECEISGVLTEDATLSASETWFLEGGLQVGNADNAARLDIDAGTSIRGDNEGATDYLLVYPGSTLSANGTSIAPVQFLSDDDGVDGSGEWGGLFLHGFEGIDATGVEGANALDHVVVAEAGAPTTISVGGTSFSYTDNIALTGVDNTTTLTFVQSHNSARDGIHIMDSSARMAWILATGSERDGIWYRDFNGLIKDLMVIHNRDTDATTGRAGIYASRTPLGTSNPRIVNATLVGRDSTSEGGDTSVNEFGILFADNLNSIRMGNVLIANFRNGCYEADTAADLSNIDTTIPGPQYIDGVHCANEAGPNGNFGVVRDGSVGFPIDTVAANNSNGNGVVYYNGAGPILPNADIAFDGTSGGIVFTGEIADRTNNFTAGWYLNSLRGISNGLVASSDALNAFLDGDTNLSGTVDAADTNSPFIIADDGEGGFNQDVADDTGGYDLTHIGAVRGGAITNAQFDGWTVGTGPTDSFTVQQTQ